MEKLLSAIQDLRAVQSELSRKQREFHAAIASEDAASSSRLGADLAELFRRSDAAFAHVHAEFGRVTHRKTAANGESRT